MRLFLWLLLAWPTPALIAGALGWKGIWGSGSAMADYLIPIPVAGGAFHTMTFVGITVLLLSQKQWPALLQGMARGVLLGITLAGAYILYDLERGRISQNPVGLFLLTDSLIAQLFVGAYGGRSAENGKEWALSLVAALVVPGLAALAIHRLDPTSGQQFAYVGGGPGPERADGFHVVHSRLPVFKDGFKPAAEAYAQQWHPLHNVNTEDVAVHFFAALEDARRGRPQGASLTYCMYQDGTPSRWSSGSGDCFDHETVTERAQKLSREKACEGVRVTAEGNAIAQLCAKR